MKHVSHGTTGLSMVSCLMVGFSTWGFAPTAQANNAHSGCYIEDDNGEFYDLGILCPVPANDLSAEPVLQTGDIQVTLRWDTGDDLDLIVVDPDGSIIDFGSPMAPSGGELDVDANGFCQTQNFTPVENIFWPTGEAPNGEYLAYVTLAIPCSLEDLANSDAAAATTAYETLQVPYTLTILVQGVTTTHDGISQPDELGVAYPFQVGSPTETPAEASPSVDISPPPDKSEDALELPDFGLPEL